MWQRECQRCMLDTEQEQKDIQVRGYQLRISDIVFSNTYGSFNLTFFNIIVINSLIFEFLILSVG